MTSKTLTDQSSIDWERGYTREDEEAVESPELTPEEIASAVPFEEMHPDLAAAMRRNMGGRPKAETTKTAVSIRLDPDVVEAFRADGPGWQSRINAALRQHLGLSS